MFMTYYLYNRKFLFQQPALKIWIDSVKNWRSYERRNQTTKKEYSLTLQLTQIVKVTFKVTCYFIWPQSFMDYPFLSDQISTQSNV